MKREQDLAEGLIELKPKMRAYLILLENAKRNEAVSEVIAKDIRTKSIPLLYLKENSFRYESRLFAPSLGLRHFISNGICVSFLGAASFSLVAGLIGTLIFPGFGYRVRMDDRLF